MVLFLCGHRGVGKNYLANQVQEEMNCQIIDTSNVLRSAYKVSNYPGSFGEWINVHEKIHGNEFTNKIICSSIVIDDSENYIVIGNRSMDGIKYIIDNFLINDYKVVFLDSNVECMLSNFNKREGTDYNEEDYNKIFEIEKDMGLHDVKSFCLEDEHGVYIYKEDNYSRDVLGEITSMLKAGKVRKRGTKDENIISN